jgi:hypothetical protein
MMPWPNEALVRKTAWNNAIRSSSHCEKCSSRCPLLYCSLLKGGTDELLSILPFDVFSPSRNETVPELVRRYGTVQSTPTTGLCRIRINIGSNSSSVLALSSATTTVGSVIPFSCMVVPDSRVLLLLLLLVDWYWYWPGRSHRSEILTCQNLAAVAPIGDTTLVVVVERERQVMKGSRRYASLSLLSCSLSPPPPIHTQSPPVILTGTVEQ